MSTRFDVTRLRLRNYRSIASCDVNLGPLALFVGPNGSGKSNVLDSLRLSAQALSENLDNALRERGGINEVRRRSRGHPTSFGVGVTFSSSEVTGEYRFQVGAKRGGDFSVTHEACWVEPINFASDRHEFHVRDGSLVSSSEETMPPVAPDRLYLVSAAGLPAFRPVFDGLSAINIYNLNPEVMRKPQTPEAGDLLRRDGTNIASVIERLRRDNPLIKRRIEDYLGQVVDGVTGVERKSIGSWESLEFRQRVAGDSSPWTFQASSMSDGTLTALGVLVALFAGPPGLSPPLGIEEPESALHPAAAGVLLDALHQASASRQVLATTHSPELLDSPTITADQVRAVRSRAGDTVIDEIDRGGMTALRDGLFTAGELLRVDQLQPTSENPNQIALFS